MDNIIKIFKALSDKTRLRLAAALLRSGKELCICELADTLKIPQYNISRHMKELKNSGLVRERKEGKFVFYSIACCEPAEGKSICQSVLKVLEQLEGELLNDDKSRLETRLALRRDGKCVVGIRKCC